MNKSDGTSRRAPTAEHWQWLVAGWQADRERSAAYVNAQRAIRREALNRPAAPTPIDWWAP